MVLPLVQKSDGVSAVVTTLVLLLGASWMMILPMGKGLLVEMRSVLVFQRLSLGWLGSRIWLLLQLPLVGYVLQGLLFGRIGRVLWSSFCN